MGKRGKYDLTDSLNLKPEDPLRNSNNIVVMVIMNMLYSSGGRSF